MPAELTSFVGRARELAEVRRLLAAARVVTLTGPGGIGKSRLALRASHQLGRHFPDGVWLAELGGLDDPDLVPYALARAMGVHEQPDHGIQDTLVAHLRERRLLVVLDNCEHLLEACRELVTALVSGCAGVRVLCTSRERLGVAVVAVVVAAVVVAGVAAGAAAAEAVAAAASVGDIAAGAEFRDLTAAQSTRGPPRETRLAAARWAAAASACSSR